MMYFGKSYNYGSASFIDLFLTIASYSFLVPVVPVVPLSLCVYVCVCVGLQSFFLFRALKVFKGRCFKGVKKVPPAPWCLIGVLRVFQGCLY